MQGCCADAAGGAEAAVQAAPTGLFRADDVRL
jgi:hypothetical protein